MKHIPLLVFSLLLVACATPKQEQNKPSAAEVAQALKKCMETTYVSPKYWNCYGNIHLWKTDAESQANQEWYGFLEKQEPDIHLLGALYSGDIQRVKAAIARGANVNREYSPSTVSGSSTGEPTTPLQAGMNTFRLDIIEVLLQNGADPSWRGKPSSGDLVSRYVFRSNGGRMVNGQRVTTTGPQMGELAYRYGYRPDAQSLLEIKRNISIDEIQPSANQVNVRAFYQKLLDASSPDVKEQVRVALLSEQKERDEARERERLVQQEQEHRQMQKENLRVANLREIGTRICTDRRIDSGYVTYMGYVENLGPRKVQIRVAQAFYRDAPSLAPGGFQPHILWDDLSSWQSC